MPRIMRAYVAFTGFLMEDGRIVIHESGSLFDKETGDAQSYSQWHYPEGTCDVEELSYTVWANMEEHL